MAVSAAKATGVIQLFMLLMKVIFYAFFQVIILSFQKVVFVFHSRTKDVSFFGFVYCLISCGEPLLQFLTI